MITAMDVADHPERDQHWDSTERSETELERLDRNWVSLLQELRVVQTGVQLLTGFLLTLPFQQRFGILDTTMRVIYLVTVGCSIGATVLLEAPVAMHRLLFRRHRIQFVVSTAHRFAYIGLLLMGLSLTGVAVVIFGTVAGPIAGAIAGASAAIGQLCFWVLLPLRMRHEPPPPTE
jgi:predicted membrane-bound spermidine synthase